MNVERKDERFWDGDYDAYGAGFNACIYEHVTRLQADCEALAVMHRQSQVKWGQERDTLKAEVEKFQAGCADLSSQARELEHKMDYWKSQNDALQSELTKALELFKRVRAVLPMQHWTLNSDIETFLTHQSAPAGKDISCKRVQGCEGLDGHRGPCWENVSHRHHEDD